MAFQLKRTWLKGDRKGWTARRGCPGPAAAPGSRAVQNLGYPRTGPRRPGRRVSFTER